MPTPAPAAARSEPPAFEPFPYRGGALYAEGSRLSSIADRFGTPLYVYSRAALEAAWRAFDDALAGIAHQVCFAVKANGNLAVLDVLARLGSGFDIVSGGELERVIAAGGDPAKVIFSGVGKSREEMRTGLEAGIRSFNVESIPELERLGAVADELGCVAPVALRVNPDVDPDTHPHIATGLQSSKFGIPIAEARRVYARGARLPSLRMAGVGCHIGSQITSLAPFRDALSRVVALVDDLAADGIEISEVDVGGGLGIRYRDETPPSPQEYVATVREVLGDRAVTVHVEPGRAICGNAGVLLARVEYVKNNGDARFVIVDAAMNDFIRPALYDGWSRIVPCERSDRGGGVACTVAGPICESGDFLGKDRELDVEEGDLVAILSTGAYGFVMSSNYNARPRAAEVMVDGERVHLVRRRERSDELHALESRLPRQQATELRT